MSHSLAASSYQTPFPSYTLLSGTASCRLFSSDLATIFGGTQLKMPNDIPLLPPRNQQKHLDKTMISLPSDFRHLAHVGPKTPSEIDNIRNSDNVIEAVNEVSYYIKPSSSNNTLKSVRSEEPGLQHFQRVLLDVVFPSAKNEEEVVRGYENQPTSHQYVNVQPIRPSTKKYKAPAPPTPPPQNAKPCLIDEILPDPPVVFRSISKSGNLSEPIPSPKIHTPERIEAPKQNSVVIERPGELGAFNFGLDDCIPVTKQTSPLKTLSPIHRPLAIPKETPILTPGSPPKYQEDGYMSTIRSTSAQGKQILDDLDNWLDDLDDDDKEKLSTISTDESGYPTLALEKDRAFMKHLVEKYELGVEPETIRLRKKKAPAPRLPPEALSSSPTFQGVGSIPPFSARPVSMPPNRPPPSYDAPSFDAPAYEPAAVLLNGRALTKQNALDLRSSGEVSPAIARFLEDKRVKSSTMPVSLGRMTPSSGLTDVSTTSSRSDALSSAMLSNVGDDEEVLVRNEEIDEPPPVPKPRTKKSVSTEPLIEESELTENVIGEEFEVIEAKTEKENEGSEEKKRAEEKPLKMNEQLPEAEGNEDVEDDDDLIVTRF
ncbi:unnamed protein product [Caenorhabditis sp. 36 PRJEB53466]|nr:unnamed protein product [Caenorhabditis sp. 36 PRJEB53466]